MLFSLALLSANATNGSVNATTLQSRFLNVFFIFVDSFDFVICVYLIVSWGLQLLNQFYFFFLLFLLSFITFELIFEELCKLSKVSFVIQYFSIYKCILMFSKYQTNKSYIYVYKMPVIAI